LVGGAADEVGVMSWRRIVSRRIAGRAAGHALGLAIVLAPAPAGAIPVFARIYDKPCGACHTVYPQLNPEGERFRSKGLHGFTPAIKPIEIAPGVEVPGTLPLALSLAIGGDFIKVDVPGLRAPVSKRFNLEFLGVLVGAELGPHLAFIGDYAPLVTNPRTGEEIVNTRAGLGFLQAHADAWGWLGNARVGLFELPVGTSPRVHRLSTQSYLVYNTDAFSLLGRPPPSKGGSLRPQETLSLGSTQLGIELSGIREDDGLGLSVGAVAGSNNRFDQNGAKDVFVRIGRNFGFHRVGLFLYYSPGLLDRSSVRDEAWRVGPDAMLYFRSVQVTGQLLAGHDSNPTGRHEGLWWVGGFGELDYRLTPRLISLMRFEYVGMPTFDDRSRGGTAYVRRGTWQATAGAQWAIEENLKLIVESTYSESRENVSNSTVRGWSVTVRLATAFWPLTPPTLSRWLDLGGQ
jgi:hypothetical protein